MSRNLRLATFASLLFASASLVLLADTPKIRPSAETKPAVPLVFTKIAFASPRITLDGPYAASRILVTGISGGKDFDLSGQAKLTSTPPGIVKITDDGYIRPIRDGVTTLKGAYKGIEFKTLVQSIHVDHPVAPRFITDVEPVLARNSCNSGACHGAASGKGGFKLSLLGYDPDLDYLAIARNANGRRLTPTNPVASLIVRKPALQVVHKGGLRLRSDSADYRLIVDWIAAGSPGPTEKEARPVRLVVTPNVRTLPIGQTQRILVSAVMSDGKTRDVTNETIFTAGDETVATVSPDGEMKIVGPGEGTAIIRFQALVSVARLISPFNNPAALPPVKAKGTDSVSMIDYLVKSRLNSLGLPTSPICTDSDFLRRIYLDICGVLPTPTESRAFLADTGSDRRERLVDSLLARSEYVDFWTMKWGDLLRSNRKTLTDRGMIAFNEWIRESVAANKPWNEFAKEIILASGSGYETSPASYYRSSTSPQELAETTSQVFLGVRMQCAKCHNHPYEKWTQNQYYQLAAFFARVKRSNGPVAGEQVIGVASGGEVNHPKTSVVMTPCALDATPLPAEFKGDRREVLADWLTSKDNPYFSRILVNRVWRHFLGRGLVEPVDDLRGTNPATNQPLFDYLSNDFAKNGFDIKRLIRTIALTETYQRSAEPVKGNERDTRYFAHYPFKRLGAEQLMDAIAAVTGSPEKFPGYPNGTRAAQLPDSTVPSYFLELFGRPARNVTCECERQDEPNLGQVLHLMNNNGLNGRIAADGGLVNSLIKNKMANPALIEELYLSAYSRKPSPAELAIATKAFDKNKEPRKAAEDLLWALINSKEFVFNH